MYPSIRTPLPDASPAEALPRRGWLRVGRNVFFLGLTSLVTDISSEMVTAIVPLYLVTQLQFSYLQFGLFDGVYQGITGVFRIWGGVISDRRARYKEVAGAGYGLSAASRLGLLAAGTAALPVTGWLLADRVGKGVRTAPRDALISLSVVRARLGEAFGVHRAMDTFGALLGPIVAFVILDAAPRAYDAVFVISFLIAIVGLGILVLFVQNRRPKPDAGDPPAGRPSWRSALALLARPELRAVVLAAGLLSLVTIGDAFVYLTFRNRSDFTSKYFPLLYVGTALSYLLFAVPFGRLADRVGRPRVFLCGYAGLVVVYALLMIPDPGAAALVGVLGLLGAFYAATDGILAAMVSAVVPEPMRTSGLAVVTTVVALARLVASLTFGACWGWIGPVATLQWFVIGLVLAIAAAATLLRSTPRAAVTA